LNCVELLEEMFCLAKTKKIWKNDFEAVQEASRKFELFSEGKFDDGVGEVREERSVIKLKDTQEL
jgi:alpha/beta superfamily hydrolase